MLDKNALRAEMVRHGVTQKELSEMIGMSEKTFSLRMKKGAFGTDEAEKMIKILKITDPAAIFFANVVT
jgi:transcriptional regulator with XRE-family HTH domain